MVFVSSDLLCSHRVPWIPRQGPQLQLLGVHCVEDAGCWAVIAPSPTQPWPLIPELSHFPQPEIQTVSILLSLFCARCSCRTLPRYTTIFTPFQGRPWWTGALYPWWFSFQVDSSAFFGKTKKGFYKICQHAI